MKIAGKGSIFLGMVASTLISSIAVAQSLPDCMSSGQTLAVNNAQVINWKNTSKNQFHGRGHIQGKLLKIYPDLTGHHHYEVSIGANPADTIEVIYNEDFGAIPAVALGSDMEACGDYITSNSPAGGYKPSPDGAILHWVHRSPNPHHDSGYIAVNGVAYGQDTENADPK